MRAKYRSAPTPGRRVVRLLHRLTVQMEKVKLAECVELLNKPGRLLWLNFLAGIARGLGMAVGFTFLGAILIFFLRRMVALNLPVIGRFIAEVVFIVQDYLEKR